MILLNKREYSATFNLTSDFENVAYFHSYDFWKIRTLKQRKYVIGISSMLRNAMPSADDAIAQKLFYNVELIYKLCNSSFSLKTYVLM